jgi:integrase
MKQGRPHLAPLSAQVMAILEQRRAAGGEQYPFVFPSKNCGYRKPISNGSVNRFLPGHKQGKPVLSGSPTTHGFRTSFKTWAKLQWTPEGARLYDFELIEKALSHLVGNKVAQA